MDRRRRVVDLDEGRAGRDQPFELGAEDRHERLGRVVAVRVDLARAVGQPARQRVRPGQGHLEGACRPGPGEGELGDDAEAGRRGDRLDDREAVLLVVAARTQPPGGGQRPDAGQVAVELGGEEARPPHLAVAHDVDAGGLLVAQGEVDRVVEHLGQVRRTELAAFGRVDPGHEPRRPGM